MGTDATVLLDQQVSPKSPEISGKPKVKDSTEPKEDQLSVESLNLSGATIACQDQRNSDAVKNEYFRPVLTCDAASTVSIKSAYYGRFSENTCSKGRTRRNWEWYKVKCGTTYRDLTDYARRQCNGQSPCQLHGHHRIAGDPCRGVTKYTIVQYD